MHLCRHMKQCLKKSQQLLGDISDASYQLLEQCLAHIEGSDLTVTQKRMQDLLKRKARGDDVETGPEVGPFANLGVPSCWFELIHCRHSGREAENLFLVERGIARQHLQSDLCKLYVECVICRCQWQ
jgi:hypothetical protein